MRKQFDLVISFMGASACSPEMRALLESDFDPRFVFSEWNQTMMNALLRQQEKLKLEGIQRQVLILVDDIILSGKDEDSLSHMCLRGRHFNISVFACAVSYTTLPKRSRRSLDVLFMFSCPMAGDCQILCTEYANQARMARYCLQNLPEWTSLVMETLERKQRLYHYKVELHTESQTQESQVCAQDETEASRDSLLHSQISSHPDKNDVPSHGIADPEISQGA